MNSKIIKNTKIISGIPSRIKLSALPKPIPNIKTNMFVFMFGIGFGRALSLILDGMPDMIFVFFMIFEFIAAGITFYLLKAKA